MKRILFCLAAFCLAFTLTTCNTAAGGTTDEGEGETVTGEGSDHIYKFESSNDYPGVEIKLSDLKIENLSNISGYVSVTVNATLYTDEAGETKATTPDGDNKNLAQFKLLKATGSWDTDSNTFGTSYSEHTKDGMNVDGPTTWNVPDTANGVPTILLIQANWADFTAEGVKVKSVMVKSVTFTAKTGAPLFDEVYDKGSFLSIEGGNKLIFNNAMYSDTAAIYNFKNFPASLTGKRLVINFSIESHASHALESGGPVTEGAEHQIHIQAANSNKNDYNGENPGSANNNRGQLYITLDDTATTGWANNSGTITVSLDTLLAAANVNSVSGGSAFTLNAIRICNNGTNWEETKGEETIMHKRCKSYTLIINSITVE
jgi:hypothetical protein